jgi:predicted Zn-dependent protease
VSQYRYEEALAMLEPVEQHGYLVEVARSRAALGAGDAARAEMHARRALEYGPDRVAVQLALGRALLALGRLDEAERVFATAASLDAAVANPWVALGEVAEARGDRARAALLYEDAMQRRGAYAEAYWRLAALRIEAGEIEAADAILARVPEAALETPDAAQRLARAERSAGLAERAEGRLRAARRAYPGARGLEPSAAATAAPGGAGGS